jgi:hypothetical protein
MVNGPLSPVAAAWLEKHAGEVETRTTDAPRDAVVVALERIATALETIARRGSE